MITAIRLLGLARGAFKALVALVGRYPAHCACVALILAAGWLWHGRNEALAERDEAIAAHNQTIDEFYAAQEDAELAERERLARVRAEQEKITDAVSIDYSQRLAALRARYDGLRAQAARGAPARVAMPGLAEGAGGPDEVASDPGFSLRARLIASEQAEQLVALQEWVQKQSAVE